MGSWPSGSVLLALTIGAVLAAAPQDSSVRQTLFRANSAAVLVDVVVRDKDHHPVVGLQQQDFQVFEDGKRQVLT